jgi:hypothetical protein
MTEESYWLVSHKLLLHRTNCFVRMQRVTWGKTARHRRRMKRWERVLERISARHRRLTIRHKPKLPEGHISATCTLCGPCTAPGKVDGFYAGCMVHDDPLGDDKGAGWKCDGFGNLTRPALP